MSSQESRPAKPSRVGTDAALLALRRATKGGVIRPSSRSTKQSRAPQSRDPALLGPAVDDFLTDQGWEHTNVQAAVMANWAQIAGHGLAGHVIPESVSNGVLTLKAESTAWATEVRLLRSIILDAITQTIGRGVVVAIEVKGPTPPNWGAGAWRVKGRGPRDTYG